jgi:hypothetical protein
MRHLLPSVGLILLSSVATVVGAEQLVIDDFSGYATTAELQKSWNAFGKAASSGPASLAPGKGESGTNAALFQLNWDAGDNANMRLIALSPEKTDLSGYTKAKVVLKLSDDAQGYGQPATPTALRLVIKGGPDDTIWQTDTDVMPTVASGGYTTVVIPLTEATMVRESGHSSLQQTLSQASDLRLRFENQQAPEARQDAYIDALVLTQ